MLQRKEMTTLLINVITAKLLLTFPRAIITNSGNAAWLQVLYNIAAALVIFLITAYIYRGRENIISLAGRVGGRIFKAFIGIVVFAALLLNLAAVVRVFPESVKTVLLQDFNIEFIAAVFVIAAGIGAYIGIEPVAKINYIFMPIAGAVFVIFLLLLIPYYRTSNLLPLLGEGAGNIFGSGFSSISIFADMLLLNILLPHCENLGEAKKSGKKAFWISALAAVVTVIAYCLIYPYPASAEFMIPVYQLARVIHLSSFFSRFEALFQFAWSILLLLYAAIYIYALCFVWQTSFGMKDYRPLVFPVVIIALVIALIPASVLDALSAEETGNMLTYPVAFALPVIFGFVSRRYYGENKLGMKGGKR